MNFKKFISLLFVLLLGAGSVVFAANNTRNVYSVYSDNFNGAHIYGVDVSVPESDSDGIKFYPWDTSDWENPPHIIMSATVIDSTASDPAPEGNHYLRYLWGSITGGVPYSTTYVGCSYTRVKNIKDKVSIDMSGYSGGTIKFSARSDKDYAKKCKIGFQSAGSSGPTWIGTLTDINSNWQEFSINLPSSVGNVSSLFIMMIDGEPAHAQGEAFLDIDNIRWVKSSGAGISFVTKNISDDQETTGSISFSEDTFGQGWRVADQYLEMDIDGEFSNNNWEVRVYSNNTSTTTAGLYNETIDDILPMAWRVSCSTLPYSYVDDENRNNMNSLEVGETWSPNGENLLGLHDAGKVAYLTAQYGQEIGDGAKTWYPWFFIQQQGTIDYNSLVLNNVGCHTFVNTDTAGVTTQYFDAFTNYYERKPRLYIACDTKKAKAAKYETSLIINLSYE